MATKILLVDDHPLFRKGLRLLLEEEVDFKIVGEAGDGREAIDRVQALSPDVVIMDIAMPDFNGIDATRRIVSEKPSAKVVALSMHAGKGFVEDMLQAGAVGYILKKSVPEDIVNGIRAVSAGDIFLSPSITHIVVAKYKELLANPPSTAKMEDIAPILSTKFHRPAFSSDHIPRPHLLERFDKSRHLSLSLVSAPAGYGKTVLVSSWLEVVETPGAWVSLDEKDNDFRIFMNYFLTAIESCRAPESFDPDRETASLMNTLPLPPIPVLASKLINELDRIQAPFILVLDDFQFIKNEAVLDLITQLVCHPPKSMHLVLICRRDPPLPISTLRAKGSILEIRTRDLRFSAGEVSSFLKKVLGNQVDSAIVTALEKKTEGWVTGLRLIALSMHHQGELDPKLFEPQTVAQYAMEYLFSEAFSKQSPEIIQYLMGAAILDRLNDSLCEAVCPFSEDLVTRAFGGQDFIAWLRQENLFVISLDRENRWFRFHHLFKELLYSQLVRHRSPGEIATLNSKASAWFAENGMIEEALKHALAGGNHDAAAQLIAMHGFDVLNQQQWPLLERWLKMISNDTIDRNPELLVLMSWLHLIYARNTELIACIGKAKGQPPHREAMVEKIQGHLAALDSYHQYLAGDGKAALTLAQQACEIIPRDHSWAKLFASINKARAYQMLGDRAKAMSTMESVMRDPKFSSTSQADLLVNFGFIYWIDADLTNLQQSARHALTLGDKGRVSPAHYQSRYFLGITQYHRNELDAAQKNLAEVLKIHDAQHTGHFVHAAFALALVHQARGCTDEANRIGDMVESTALDTKNHDLLHVARAFKAELAFRQNRFAEASRWIENYQALPLLSSEYFYEPQCTAIKILLSPDTAGDLHQAADLLDPLHNFIVSIHNFRLQIDTLALKTLLFDSQDNEPAAIKALTEVLSLAEPGGFIHPFIDLGARMADLLRRLAGQNIYVEYIGRILAAFQDINVSPVQAVSDLPATPSTLLVNQPLVDPLTNREMEILDLLAKRLSNKEIAEKMFISPGTVKKHLNNIYGKLNVNGRRQAVEKAGRLKIIF